ncbi:MAG: hypothetical protein ACO1N3_02245 [Gammaproteobacteria bacterium]
MDWSHAMTQIRDRLPELEHHILKLGGHFPLNLLPPGLFKDVAIGTDCLTDIARDLDRMSVAQSSERMLNYWGERLSQKIHVLVHICRNQPVPSKEKQMYTLDSMGTRTHWLAQIEAKQNSLNLRRKSLVATLETMQTRKDKEAIHAIQKELLDIDAQLARMFE